MHFSGMTPGYTHSSDNQRGRFNRLGFVVTMKENARNKRIQRFFVSIPIDLSKKNPGANAAGPSTSFPFCESTPTPLSFPFFRFLTIGPSAPAEAEGKLNANSVARFPHVRRNRGRRQLTFYVSVLSVPKHSNWKRYGPGEQGQEGSFQTASLKLGGHVRS